MNHQQAKFDLERIEGYFIEMSKLMRQSKDATTRAYGNIAKIVDSTAIATQAYYKMAAEVSGSTTESVELINVCVDFVKAIDSVVDACGVYAESKLEDNPTDNWLLSMRVFSKFARQDDDARLALFRLLETM